MPEADIIGRYLNQRTAVEFFCRAETNGNVHGTFWQKPGTIFAQGSNGCPICTREKRQRIMQAARPIRPKQPNRDASMVDAAMAMTEADFLGFFRNVQAQCTNTRKLGNELMKNPSAIQFLRDTYGDLSLTEYVHLAREGLPERPTCRQCGGPLRFYGGKIGYKETCSYGCSRKYEVQTGAMKLRVKSIRATMVKRYGVPNGNQIHFSPDQIRFLDSKEEMKRKLQLASIEQTARDLSLSTDTISKYARLHNIELTPRHSRSEAEIAQLVEGMGLTVVRSARDVIPPKEIDIFIPEKHFAIEYSGLFWHSEQHGGKDRYYHHEKLIRCQEQGIRLVTVFEDEWMQRPSVVESRLAILLQESNAKKISARDCTAAEISPETASAFLNEHHLQGFSRAKVHMGLQYRGQIVAVMSFSSLSRAKGRQASEGNYELVRYGCSGIIRGGASKLLTSFERLCSPRLLVSYADLRWSTGSLYRTLGFSLVRRTRPNYWYFKPQDYNTQVRIHRYSLRKNKNDDPTLTEWGNRRLQGWDRIWDCGNLVFEKDYRPLP